MPCKKTIGSPARGEVVALGGVAGQQQGLVIGEAGLFEAAEPAKVFGAGGGQVVVADQLPRQLVGAGNPVRDAGGGDLLLGPGDPGSHGRLAGQERAGDLGGSQPAQQPQGERHPGVRGERWVAAGEDQPQPVIGDHVPGIGLTGGCDRGVLPGGQADGTA